MEKSTIDYDQCVLCENCIDICPSVFFMNASNFIEVADLETYDIDDITDAANSCLANCINFKT